MMGGPKAVEQVVDGIAIRQLVTRFNAVGGCGLSEDQSGDGSKATHSTQHDLGTY
jgi:hypothetical protein